MNLQTKQYVIIPVRLEVVELTHDNAAAVAIWCGGEVVPVNNAFSRPSASQLHIPSVHGPLSAEIGSLIALDKTTGRFSVMTKDHLEREYQQVGQRQDGFTANSKFPKLHN